MLDPKNLVTLTGGLIEDPEFIAQGKLLKLRVAVDYAGSDKNNPDNKTGYFDCIHFVNENDPASKFITGQVSQNNLSKGSQVQLVGRLQHQRFTDKNDNKRSTVGLVVEALTYASGGRNNDSGGSTSSGGGSSEGSIPDEF